MARLVFTDKDHNAYDPKKYRVSVLLYNQYGVSQQPISYR